MKKMKKTKKFEDYKKNHNGFTNQKHIKESMLKDFAPKIKKLHDEHPEENKTIIVFCGKPEDSMPQNNEVYMVACLAKWTSLNGLKLLPFYYKNFSSINFSDYRTIIAWANVDDFSYLNTRDDISEHALDEHICWCVTNRLNEFYEGERAFNLWDEYIDFYNNWHRNVIKVGFAELKEEKE